MRLVSFRFRVFTLYSGEIAEDATTGEGVSNPVQDALISILVFLGWRA